jgi:hypothetical protein
MRRIADCDNNWGDCGNEVEHCEQQVYWCLYDNQLFIADTVGQFNFAPHKIATAPAD